MWNDSVGKAASRPGGATEVAEVRQGLDGRGGVIHRPKKEADVEKGEGMETRGPSVVWVGRGVGVLPGGGPDSRKASQICFRFVGKWTRGLVRGLTRLGVGW